jgi:hypothetical protein
MFGPMFSAKQRRLEEQISALRQLMRQPDIERDATVARPREEDPNKKLQRTLGPFRLPLLTPTQAPNAAELAVRWQKLMTNVSRR